MALEDITGYSLRRGLGSGSVGAVWLVRNLGSGRHAVLKRLPAASVPAAAEFRRDLALAQGVSHAHVARLLEVRQTEREWLLFSQYVAAGTLTGLLQRRGPLSLGELVTLVTPLAQALGALHRAGLTHGRLDVGDVMFDADGRPMLTDAGLRLLAVPPGTSDPSPGSADGASARAEGPQRKVVAPDHAPDPAVGPRTSADRCGTDARLGAADHARDPAVDLYTSADHRATDAAGSATDVPQGPADGAAFDLVRARPGPAGPGAVRGALGPDEDLAALAALAVAAGGDPHVFSPTLFSGDAEEVGQRVLELAPPQPINLGFGDERKADAPAPRPGGSDRSARPVRPLAPSPLTTRPLTTRPLAPGQLAGQSDGPPNVRRQRDQRTGRRSESDISTAPGPVPTSTDPLPTDLAPSKPAPTSPAPTDLAPSKPTPTDPAPTVSALTEPAPADLAPIDSAAVPPAEAVNAGAFRSRPRRRPPAAGHASGPVTSSVAATAPEIESATGSASSGRVGAVARRSPGLRPLPGLGRTGRRRSPGRLERRAPRHSRSGVLAMAGFAAIVVLAVGLTAVRVLGEASSEPELAGGSPSGNGPDGVAHDAEGGPDGALPDTSSPSSSWPSSSWPSSTSTPGFQPSTSSPGIPTAGTTAPGTPQRTPSSPPSTGTTTSPTPPGNAEQTPALPSATAQTSQPDAGRSTAPPGTIVPSMSSPNQSTQRTVEPDNSQPRSSPVRTALPDRSPPTTAQGDAGEVARWLRTLQVLDQRRSQVFATTNAAGLDFVYVRGSSPWRSDRSLLATYRQRGLRVDGLRLDISGLEVQRRAAETRHGSAVVLRVIDRLVAGAVVDRTGRRTPLPPGKATARFVTLTAEEAGWRISDVVTA